MNITEDLQDLDLGSIVDLYELDMNPLGINEILYWTPSNGSGESLYFGGHEYVSRGIEMSGFSRSARDAPPEPTLTVSNVDKGGNALLSTYDNLIGAKVTKRRTLAKYLDRLSDNVTPNPQASWAHQFIPEIWYVEQKEEGNRILVKWRMKSILDLEGMQLPGRDVLKTFCGRTYRLGQANGSFRYALNRACPYAGNDKFKRDGTPTNLATEDECDKTHNGCALRFKDGLPTWAFPGADRIGD